jgi:DHA3 family multidrug efflux protein-like MFS transporter
MTFEAAASPITALMIAPVAEFFIVPYMETAAGQERWGPLLGAGESRGIALVFFWSGVAMIVLGAAAFFTRTYRTLSFSYAQAAPVSGVAEATAPAAATTEGEGAPAPGDPRSEQSRTLER